LLSAPGDGLDSSLTGQRYLLTEPTGSIENTGPYSSNPKAWAGLNGQPLIARANDIVEYDGQRWRVSFDSQTMPDTQYVTNITTGIQYKWLGIPVADVNAVGEWVKSYDGLYPGGSWNLIL
jgi:hypothetical protein